jgi:threonine dehydrogenase-like Zn-dependent dehydrogenase
METALNAVWDAQLKAGDNVSIVGAGVVGCLIALLAKQYPGTRVQLVDVDPGRRETAEALGVEFAVPEDARVEADVVLHASGQGEGLRTALRLAGMEASVVELSWYGTTEVSLPLGESFHPRRQRIIGSQVGSLPATQRSRWDPTRRLKKALELCRAPELDHLISGESAFSDLPRVMERLAQEGGLCHRIRYD